MSGGNWPAVAGRTDGSIEIHFASPVLLLTQREAATLVCQVLTAARLASERASAPETEMDIQPQTEVVASQVGLSSSAEPGCHCLMLAFGQTRIGITLEPGVIRALGQSMMALSAGGQGH
ncbi:MAG TPA: hypothetical protein DDW98_10405 [Gammaproteobacteria bacterium]|nr:hypothetical protein [Gammaproteobacteria bacterium]